MVVGRNGDKVWGRAYGYMMMIVESAPTLAEVKAKVKAVIEREGAILEGFDIEYDLSSLLPVFPFSLNLVLVNVRVSGRVVLVNTQTD